MTKQLHEQVEWYTPTDVIHVVVGTGMRYWVKDTGRRFSACRREVGVSIERKTGFKTLEAAKNRVVQWIIEDKLS